MRTHQLVLAFAVPFLFCASSLFAQGMTLDSLLPRIGGDLHNPALAEQLRDLIPDYANTHVWGYAAGDFTRDSLPDLALSLYDPGRARNSVEVYLFENVDNKRLVGQFKREIPFVESPMEVGLSVDSSVVTITQKISEDHWRQEGYSIVYGDLTLVDRFETQQENIAGAGNGKAHPLGHEVYRNYQSLRTRESYFTGTAGGSMLSESYFTLPAYDRMREIYPGYGHLLSDTSKDFIIDGVGLRRDATDLSIRSMQAAYDDDYLYLAVRVRDDYVTGGQPNIAANDRVSFWFDTKYTGDRLNRDRRILSEQGGFPTFRTSLDSLVSNITFVLPAHPGKVTQITYSTVSQLTPMEQEGLNKVRAVMEYDTGRAVVDGYRLTLKIPFAFLGFESNPEHAYETPVPIGTKEETSDLASTASISDAATLGFTALIYDVDDPARPNEVTTEATSKYEAGNPSTFGTLVLEPSALYYGEVHPTYLDMIRKRLQAAGY